MIEFYNADLNRIRDGFVVSEVRAEILSGQHTDNPADSARKLFDEAIQHVKYEVFEEVKSLILRGDIPYWYQDEDHHGFDIIEDEDGRASESGARMMIAEILSYNPYVPGAVKPEPKKRAPRVRRTPEK